MNIVVFITLVVASQIVSVVQGQTTNGTNAPTMIFNSTPAPSTMVSNATAVPNSTQAPITTTTNMTGTNSSSSGSNNSTNATNVPPNDCDKTNPGDFYIFLLDSLDPDAIAIFVLNDLPQGLVLYLTDNAWTGTQFQATEGTYSVRQDYETKHNTPKEKERKRENKRSPPKKYWIS